MSIKALQDYTYVSKFARYKRDVKRRETWTESCDRVKEMHLIKYADRIKLFPQLKDEIDWAFEMVKQRRVLGSQRCLQFGGKPILDKNARAYNCTVSYCDRLRFFQETLWLLLCGCGVGFSVQKHHIEKLPRFSEKKRKEVKTYFIPDSIEGWSDSLGVLLASYFEGSEFSDYEGFKVEFDYSLIRPAGAPISSGNGKAPGPEPLRKALELIRGLLDRCDANGQSHLRPIDAYDIIMHASDAVISGGVRRSATICIFSLDDQEMVTAKTGNWFIDNPQRGRSNNSALLLRDSTTKAQFKELMKSVKEFGEPGFVWADSVESMFNPCTVGEVVIKHADGLGLAKELTQPFTAVVDGHTYKANGFWKTGNKNVVELTFASGRKLEVTPDHKILTVKGWKEAGSLTPDDRVVVNNHREHKIAVDKTGPSYAKGYCLGYFLGNGNISEGSAQMKWWGEHKDKYRLDGLQLLGQAGWASPHHKWEPENKAVCSSVDSKPLFEFAESKGCNIIEKKSLSKSTICGDWSYLAGLVSGYFDADGTVLVNPEKGSSIRIWSVQVENLRNLQIVLNAFGVFSKIYEDRTSAGMKMLPDGKGGYAEYYCESGNELIISCDNIEHFANSFPIRNKKHIDKINEIIASRKRTPNCTTFIDKLISKVDIGAEDVYDCTVEDVHAFDANTIYTHNCVEIGLFPQGENGESGFAFCNLCEINGRKIKSKEDWQKAARAGAILGTLQAGYTDFAYLGKISEAIARREALLGVSITGMMDNPEIIFDPKLQKEMAKLVVETNEKIAPMLGINPTARATCIKPAGTTSCVLGTASGIHPHHAKRYFRRVQANTMEAPLRFFKTFNKQAVEKSVWSANGTDEVVTFCVEVPDGAKVKNDLDAVKLLEHVKLTQQNWVAGGKVKERCSEPWLSHNVSNTINVRPDEWDEVTDYIYENRKFFCGISLLPISGDKDYQQAPMCAVFTPREIVAMYGDGSLMASGLIVDGLKAFEGNLWEACEAVMGLGKPVNTLGKEEWVRRAKQFAERYFENDVRQMTYCLKDVNNWKTWLDLRREYKEVDYSEMIEEKDETTTTQEWACAGGTCSLV